MVGFEIRSKIFVFMHFFYRDGWPAMGRSSFFLMSGDGDGLVVCQR